MTGLIDSPIGQEFPAQESDTARVIIGGGGISVETKGGMLIDIHIIRKNIMVEENEFVIASVRKNDRSFFLPLMRRFWRCGKFSTRQ